MLHCSCPFLLFPAFQLTQISANLGKDLQTNGH